MTASGKPRVGISACLMGEKVRYDGRDKRGGLLLEALGPLVEWVPVCPELEAGLGVPREPIVLVGPADGPRLLGERSGADHTVALRRWAAEWLEEVVAGGLHGWVTKKGSPSCGLRRVALRSTLGATASAEGVGLFVLALRARLPELPIADEEQLQDAGFRRAFVDRCLARLAG